MDARMPYVHVYTTRRTNQRDNERSERASELKKDSCIAPSAARAGDMLSVWERLFSRALRG